MNAKLLIIGACLAFAAANYAPAVDNLEDILETEDGIYARVSDEEAEHLRLSRQVQPQELAAETIGILPEPKIAFLPNELVASQLQYLNTNTRRYKRQFQPYNPFQLQLQNGGKAGIYPSGGAGKQFSIGAQPQAKLWQSQNGRNTLHAIGSYSQETGLRPNFGGNLVFTHRFG